MLLKMPAILVSEVGPIALPSSFLSHHDSTFQHRTSTLSFKTHDPTNTHSLIYLLNGSMDSSTYASTLDSCNCPNLGSQVHSHTLKTGFTGHQFIETKLLQMYCRCGSAENAELMFDKMPQRNIYSWLAILTLFSDSGHFEKVISIFQNLLLEDIFLEFFVFPVVFNAVSGLCALELGRQVHGLVVKSGFVLNIYVGNALIDMYGKCGSLIDAKKFLATMNERDCVSWNSVVSGCASNGLVFEALEFMENMSSSGSVSPNLVTWSAVIGGFAQNGYDKEALELLYRMQENGFKPNSQTIASVLPACCRLRTLSIGKEFHGYIMRHGYMTNPFVVNGLVNVYRRCADMRTAIKIFSKFSARNLVSFNTMVVGYSENGEISKAKELFDQMEFVGVKKDIISWNSMISGYVDNGLSDKALKIFRASQFEGGVEADSFTLGSALTACADMAALRQGKEIHSFAITRGLHSNSFVGGSLVELYCKCHDLVAARMVFDEVIGRDIATWNALISGYARFSKINDVHELLVDMKRDGIEPNIYTWNGIIAGCIENGENKLALELFHRLRNSNLNPDIYTVGIIITACSRLATIRQGKQIHAHSVRHGYDTDVHIGASLVDMYAKCGSIKHAWETFKNISKPNLVSWNSILAGYAMHGHGEEGIAVFRCMLTEGIRPDAVTFLLVLSSCVHAGLVDLGYEYFHLMAHYAVEPTLKHYTCMVDLLSRAGRLREAYDLVKKTQVAPDPVMWCALLGGCVVHRNIALGEIAAQKLIELEPDNAGNHILLANLYASAGRWDDLVRTRQNIKDKRLHKSPGCSWIEDRDQIQVFLASDKSHNQSKEIYETLHSLTFHIRKEAYNNRYIVS